MENLMRQWNLNHITVLKILKCFMTNGCRKWRNRFKIEQFVALAEYLEQLPDCNRYKKIANREKTLCGGISRIYLSFSNIWKPCHGAINIRLRNLRTALKNTFDFTEIVNNYELKRGTGCQILRFTSQFSLKLYIQFWKYLHCIVLGSQGRDYCKK